MGDEIEMPAWTQAFFFKAENFKTILYSKILGSNQYLISVKKKMGKIYLCYLRQSGDI